VTETQEEADYKKFIKAHDMGYDDIHKSFMQDKSEMETRHKERTSGAADGRSFDRYHR
jgi:hypothetical protein